MSPLESSYTPEKYSPSKVLVHFKKKEFTSNYKNYETHTAKDLGSVLYHTDIKRESSEPSLVETERDKLNTLSACDEVKKNTSSLLKCYITYLML